MMGARKRTYILAISAAIIVASLGSGYIISKRDTTPIPKSIRSSFDFPLFYPSALPDGWRIDKDSYSKGADVLTYTVSSTRNEKVFISIQPQPDTFDFDNFYKKTLGKPSQFTTSIGQATTGEGEAGYKIGSLATGDSWVLMSTTAKDIKAKDLRTLLSGLKEVQN